MRIIYFLRFILLLLFSCWTMISDGQNILLKGRILDSTTKKPVEMVNIYLLHDPWVGTVSNEDGQYFLKIKKSDTIVYSHISYRTYLYNPPLKDTVNDIFLVRRPENLKEVVIKANNQEEISAIISNIRKRRKINYVGLRRVYYKVFTRVWDMSGNRLSEFQEYFLHLCRVTSFFPKLKIIHARAKAFAPKAVSEFGKARPYMLLAVFDDYTLIYNNDFLKVSGLNKFDCSLLQEVNIDRHSCYHIRLIRKNKKETWNLFVDKKTYALVMVEYKRNEYSKSLESGVINYQQVDGKWYLKSSRVSLRLDSHPNDVSNRLSVYTKMNTEPLKGYLGFFRILKIHITKFSSGFNSAFWKNNMVVPIPWQIEAQIK